MFMMVLSLSKLRLREYINNPLRYLFNISERLYSIYILATIHDKNNKTTCIVETNYLSFGNIGKYTY